MSSCIALATWIDIIDATQLAFAPLADTIKAAAFADTVVPAPETDVGYGTAPWNAGEATGGTYSAGGFTLATKSLSIASRRIIFASDATSGLNATGVTCDLRYILLWDDTLASDRAVYEHDLGGTFPLVADTLQINIPNGWFGLRG
jgi:hypothetical protein